jgi:predicted peptidase
MKAEFLSAALLLMVSQAAMAQSLPPGVHQLSFNRAGADPIPYGLSVPAGYSPAKPRPLVLALHPGGGRMLYYGSRYMQQIVLPALRALDAVVVAPDCPTSSWGDAESEQGVMALLERVLSEYAIDRRRILVTGFSMGGRGTWFMSSHHADLFTAAIPIAAPSGGDTNEPGTLPTYVIHSRDDEVVPFGPAERHARELQAKGRPLVFEAIDAGGHFQMGAYVPALTRAGRWVVARWEEGGPSK